MNETMAALTEWAKTLKNEAARREVSRILTDYQAITSLQAGSGKDMSVERFQGFLERMRDKSGPLFGVIDDLGNRSDMTTAEHIEFTKQALIKGAQRLMES